VRYLESYSHKAAAQGSLGGGGGGGGGGRTTILRVDADGVALPQQVRAAENAGWVDGVLRGIVLLIWGYTV
jgi:hypothetical protein